MATSSVIFLSLPSLPSFTSLPGFFLRAGSSVYVHGAFAVAVPFFAPSPFRYLPYQAR